MRTYRADAVRHGDRIGVSPGSARRRRCDPRERTSARECGIVATLDPKPDRKTEPGTDAVEIVVASVQDDPIDRPAPAQIDLDPPDGVGLAARPL